MKSVLLHLEIHSMFSSGLIHIASLWETYLKLAVQCADVQEASLKTLVSLSLKKKKKNLCLRDIQKVKKKDDERSKCQQLYS